MAHLNQSDRDDLDSIIQVIVGSAKVSFAIHKSLLCHASSYFNAALNGGFREAFESTVALPEDDSSVFKRFQLWLYSDYILQPSETVDTLDWKFLLQIYKFSDARGAPGLQNMTIDVLIDKDHASLTAPPLFVYTKPTYDAFPENGPLRRLIVDMVAYKAEFSHPGFQEAKARANYSKKFLVDLALAYYEIVKGSRKRIEELRTIREDYHINTSDEGTKAGDSMKAGEGTEVDEDFNGF